MTVILNIVLAFLAQIAPMLSTASAIEKIIVALIDLLPAIIKEAQDLVPIVKNVIATLKGNPATTPQQLDDLDALDAKVDADFEAALAAADAEDAAAKS